MHGCPSDLFLHDSEEACNEFLIYLRVDLAVPRKDEFGNLFCLLGRKQLSGTRASVPCHACHPGHARAAAPGTGE